jgi:hypothetical protein
MAVTDTYVANDLIYRLLENGNADAAYPSLLSDMFTTTEIIDSMNRVQQNFLLDTGMILTRTTLTPVVGQRTYALPADSIRPRRVTWTEDEQTGSLGFGMGGFGSDGFGGDIVTAPVTRTLTQVDTWELDTGASDWPSDRDVPIAWYENNLPQQTIGIAKAPLNDGTIGLLYVQLAATLTGAGVAFTIPDDWTPYILYGTLAELIGSDGPSFDPVRASYCTTRYQEGVELARLVLGGQS